MKDPEEIVLWILEEVETWIDQNGIKNRRYSWKIADRNINLGSCVNPNLKIKEIKYGKRGVRFGDFLRG